MGGLCSSGVGMRLTQRIQGEDGEREEVGVQPYERPEEGRDGGGQCVLVHHGIRRAMSLVEAVFAPRDWCPRRNLIDPCGQEGVQVTWTLRWPYLTGFQFELENLQGGLLNPVDSGGRIQVAS